MPGNIVDFWNSDFLKKSPLDLPSAWIFFFTFFFAWIFFLGIFPCMNFFLVFLWFLILKQNKVNSKNWGETNFEVSKKQTSSETQGQSVGSGEKVGRKFSSTGERAPGYRLSPNYFQKFKRIPAPDWAQKMLCIIMPNRRTVSPEFFSWVHTRRLLFRSRLVWLMQQRNARSQEFSLI